MGKFREYLEEKLQEADLVKGSKLATAGKTLDAKKLAQIKKS